MLEDIYTRDRQPEILLTDNGGEFILKIMVALHIKRGIELRHGSPYKPSTQGAIESRNHTLKWILRNLLADCNQNKHSIKFLQFSDLLNRANVAMDHELHCTIKDFPLEVFSGKTDNAYYTPPGIGKQNLFKPREQTNFFLQCHPLT